MSKYISKEVFLNAMTCPRLGWVRRHHPLTDTLSLHDQFLIDEGVEIGRRARKLYPDGILVKGNNNTAVETTAKLIRDSKCSVIFESTFVSGDFIARADILLRKNNGWKIIEVKSATNLNHDLIEDIAYTTMVVKKAGLNVVDCSLMLVTKDYIIGMSNKKLFKTVDCKNEVFEVVGEFEKLNSGVLSLLKSNNMPESSFELVCKGCSLFEQCWRNIADHIFDLPRLSHTKFCQLKEMDVFSIEDIPEDFKLTDNQKIVREAVLTGQPVLNKQGLKQTLGKLVYPAYYLDFETVQTAIPLYENIAPYTQIPTQYSIHICNEAGKVIDHREFLADPNRDCRRELAENLIKDCGKEGSIFSYSHFEKTIINGLIEAFPCFEKKLKQLIERLVDLKEIIARNYYHPDFHGSYSIKNVLPVMVPDMLSYENMEVNNGSDAIAVFARMARGEYSEEEMGQIRNSLLEYCKLDTMAMVKLHERLVDIVG